jgi:hypothetical protein
LWPNDVKVNDVADADFTNFASGVYSLESSSPFYRAATDGRDIGVNWSVLQAGIDGVI